MNKIIIFFIFYCFAQPVMSTDIDYSGKINISEFEAKSIKSNWCIFSDGNSNTATNSISSAATGSENSHLETYSHRGTTYLQRKIDWQSEQNKNGMRLKFQAGDAQFSGKEVFDDKLCSYKTWLGESTSAEAVLNARAAFVIPKNVWAIKIKMENDVHGGVADLSLSNDDYINIDGKNILVKKPFFNFETQATEKYFLVNPSIEGKENFVYLDFQYKSRTLVANNFSLTFSVEFIAEEQCLDSLTGMTVEQIFERDFQSDHLENTLVNVSCMLNTNYIKYNLGIMHIDGLSDFFKKLDRVEKMALKDVESTSSSERIQILNIILKLLDRIKFYYSYEVMKDTMGMLTTKMAIDGQYYDGFGYLIFLQKNSSLYLLDIIHDLVKNIDKIKLESSSSIVKLSAQDRLKFEIFLKNIVPLEFKNLEKRHSLIYRPQYLSNEYINNIDLAFQRFNQSISEVAVVADLILSDDTCMIAQLKRLKNVLQQVVSDEHFYYQQIDNITIDHSEADAQHLRSSFLNQIETLYQVDLSALSNEVGIYFSQHFEDPDFKNNVINGKIYGNVNDFVTDFQQLIREIR